MKKKLLIERAAYRCSVIWKKKIPASCQIFKFLQTPQWYPQKDSDNAIYTYGLKRYSKFCHEMYTFTVSFSDPCSNKPTLQPEFLFDQRLRLRVWRRIQSIRKQLQIGRLLQGLQSNWTTAASCRREKVHQMHGWDSSLSCGRKNTQSRGIFDHGGWQPQKMRSRNHETPIM